MWLFSLLNVYSRPTYSSLKLKNNFWTPGIISYSCLQVIVELNTNVVREEWYEKRLMTYCYYTPVC